MWKLFKGGNYSWKYGIPLQIIQQYEYSKTSWLQVGFRRDSATFRDNRTEVLSLSRDKGTMGQAKNLAKGWDGPGQPKFGTGRDSVQNRTEQKRMF